MTDAQLGILVTAIVAFGTAIAGALKWAVGRITKALDDNTSARDKQTDAMLDHARAMTTLAVKIDAVADFVQEHTPVNQPIPRRTPGGGVRVVEVRRGTHSDGDR